VRSLIAWPAATHDSSERPYSQIVDSAYVWVFNGDGKALAFPGGVFSSREKAEAWIRANALSGVLTAYPIDQGAYDWARDRGYLEDWTDDDGNLRADIRDATPQRIGRFSTAHQPHYHFERGEPAG
jgi:hypothetical protein